MNKEIYIVKGEIIGITDERPNEVLAVYDNKEQAIECVKKEFEDYLKMYKAECWDGESEIELFDDDDNDKYFTVNYGVVIVEVWIISAYINESINHLNEL